MSVLDNQLQTFEEWFRFKSESIKGNLKSSVEDLQKYLELDNLVREKNEVLNRLSHLPINVRKSMTNSILLLERQFNMLNNYELNKKVIVASGMVTKLALNVEDDSLLIGGVGTFISKYSLQTKKVMLTSEKSKLPMKASIFLQWIADR